MGEILECIFGTIYGNKAKMSLEMLICGVCSYDMVIINKLIIIMEDHLNLKCIVNEGWYPYPVQGEYTTGKVAIMLMYRFLEMRFMERCIYQGLDRVN